MVAFPPTTILGLPLIVYKTLSEIDGPQLLIGVTVTEKVTIVFKSVVAGM